MLAANIFCCLPVEADILYEIMRPLKVDHLAANVTCKLMSVFNKRAVTLPPDFSRSKRIEQCIPTPDSFLCKIILHSDTAGVNCLLGSSTYMKIDARGV